MAEATRSSLRSGQPVAGAYAIWSTLASRRGAEAQRRRGAEAQRRRAAGARALGTRFSLVPRLLSGVQQHGQCARPTRREASLFGFDQHVQVDTKAGRDIG